MSRSRGLVIITAGTLAAAAAFVLLAIGGAAAAARAHSASATTLGTEKTKLGKVIDVSGRAVYLSTKDTSGKSNCYGKCAATWPPLIARGRVSVAKGSGLSSKLVGTLRRSNGQMQVTYHHQPLYFYSKDGKGTTHGENKKRFGRRWYLVSPRGKAVRPRGSCPPGWKKTPTGCLAPGYW